MSVLFSGLRVEGGSIEEYLITGKYNDGWSHALGGATWFYKKTKYGGLTTDGPIKQYMTLNVSLHYQIYGIHITT